ncbi:putative protein-S-isoprenylcysteine O-methyltransferase [Termitomyces sp. J132]|nr:putative protein-S-isoprenylcysteine O-methyltransferase [Termitomyces sp. J132]
MAPIRVSSRLHIKQRNIHKCLIQNTFWLVAAAEIAAILLSGGKLTSPDTTKRALRILMPRGRVADLRLTPLSITGSFLVLAGCWLRLKAFRTLREFYTFEMTLRENHRLVTSGPYRYVRHPGYTAFTTIFLGLCCWFSSRGSWVRESGILGTVAGKAFVGSFTALFVKMWVSLLQRMPEEDCLMQASFGKEWEDWARRVPYWLIPGVY